jgi:hypothetical protein
MAPLLRTYFNPAHRSFLSTLFASTFLGAVLVVSFPCPARPNATSLGRTGRGIGGVSADGEGVVGRKGREEIVIMMRERGGRRFLDED